MTNFDKLKEEIEDMTPEELVALFHDFCDKVPFETCLTIPYCDNCLLQYLKSEVEE